MSNFDLKAKYWKTDTSMWQHGFLPTKVLPFKSSIRSSSYNWAKHWLSARSFKTAGSSAVCVVLYELLWITERYSAETDLSADGDEWTWLNSPSPAEETERLARAQGSGRCREGDAQWRGGLPNEQTCLRFEIMLSDADSSAGTVAITEPGYLCGPALCVHSGLMHSAHRDNFSVAWSGGIQVWSLVFKLSRATGMRSLSNEMNACSILLKKKKKKQVATKQSCSPMKLQLANHCFPPAFSPAAFLIFVHWKCQTRESFTADLLLPRVWKDLPIWSPPPYMC